MICAQEKDPIATDIGSYIGPENSVPPFCCS